MKVWVGVGALALVALGALVWNSDRGPEPTEPAHAQGDEAAGHAEVELHKLTEGGVGVGPDSASVPASAPAVSPAATPAVSPAVSPAVTAENRTPLVTPAVTLDGGGVPRSVTWRWIPLEERFDGPSWRVQDWNAVRALKEGAGQLGSQPLSLDAPAGTHALWVFPDGAPSMWTVVGDEPVSLKVAPGSVAKLTVSRGGVPMPGATIELFGTGGGVGGGLGPKVAAKTFYRRLTTGRDGTTSVERWAGEVAFVATFEGERSRAVVTKFVPELDLGVTPTFSVKGRVGDGTKALAGELVEVGLVGETVWEQLGKGIVAADGSFELLDVPVADTDEIYVQLLTRSGIAPQLVFRPAPKANESLTIEFLVEPARALTVEVLGGDGEPLRDVSVMLAWGQTTEFPHSTEWFLTGDKGTVEFAAVRLGAISVITYRDQHGQRAWPVADETAWESGSLSLRYEASREITIRTQSTNGESPPRATLLHWRTNSAQAIPVEMQSSALKLQLEEGLHWFLAFAPERARTAPQLVQVGATDPDDLVFTLDEPRRAHGRLVDAAGAPFVGGLIQPYVNAGSQLLVPFGEALVSDDAGLFSGAFLAPGDNRVIVQAEGGNPAIYTFQGDGDAPGALGDIPIYAPQRLDVQLADALVQWGVHELALTGGVRREPARTSATGSFTIENCAPGKYTIQLEHPDGSFSIMSLTQSSRGPWTRVLGSNDAVLLTHDPELIPLPIRERANQLHITMWSERLGCSVTRVVAIGEQLVAIPNLGAGRATLQWATPEGEVIARSDMDLAPGGTAFARPGDPVRSAIVAFESGDGSPLVGATIWYAHPGGSGAWDGVTATGSDGRGLIDGVVGDTLLLGIVHPLLGYAFGVELALAGSAHEGRVVVRGDSSLHVRLTDGPHVIRGVEVSLACPEPDMSLTTTVPAADGWTRFGRLGSGRYQVRVLAPGWFPVTEDILVSGRTEHTIAVRRTGGLELTVARAGEPAVGVRIELQEESGPSDVGAWLDEGYVSGSLVADVGGRILLEGLPRGKYVARTEGLRLEFEVLAGQRTARRIDLP